MKHCDDYIDDHTADPCLRAFLEHARSPAHGYLLGTPQPRLFADYCGQRVRVVMASRLGDVGVTSDLTGGSRYEERVSVDMLFNFGTDP